MALNGIYGNDVLVLKSDDSIKLAELLDLELLELWKKVALVVLYLQEILGVIW